MLVHQSDLALWVSTSHLAWKGKCQVLGTEALGVQGYMNVGRQQSEVASLVVEAVV